MVTKLIWSCKYLMEQFCIKLAVRSRAPSSVKTSSSVHWLLRAGEIWTARSNCIGYKCNVVILSRLIKTRFSISHTKQYRLFYSRSRYPSSVNGCVALGALSERGPYILELIWEIPFLTLGQMFINQLIIWFFPTRTHPTKQQCRSRG